MDDSEVRLPDIPRTIGAIAEALPEHRLPGFWQQVGALGDGDDLELLLDDWWLQAVVDSAGDNDLRRAQLEEAAELHLAERVKSSQRPLLAHHEVEALLAEDAREAQP
ncbi:hypothetical protein [Streptomyces endophytica]|uniref:Uncharacterized protein n=1 Tax=Streptomyces endophytica TaxID=2991496 RepID=A0ABY6P8E3_9ACTN|nr:hypothetical protein [Streptomyces endophytica]UZJ30089.1 hypothetical protein OJ254_06265 [Streptomyces endophytica]